MAVEIYTRAGYPAGGGGGGGPFTITVVSPKVGRNGNFRVDMATGIYRFGSPGVTLAVTVDGITATTQVINGSTLYVTCPNGAAIGTGKAVNVSITPSGGTTEQASGVIEVVAGVALTYVSDGDTNGLFYYLGTNEGAGAWNVANVSSVVSAFNVDDNSSNLASRAFDRSNNEFSALLGAGRANVSTAFILQGTRFFEPRVITLQGRSVSNSSQLQTWQFQASTTVFTDQASVDQSNWALWDTLLNVHQDPLPQNGWRQWTLPPCLSYKSFRILYVGFSNTSTTSKTALIRELELYGVYRPS